MSAFESALDVISSDLYRLRVVSLDGRGQRVLIQLEAEQVAET